MRTGTRRELSLVYRALGQVAFALWAAPAYVRRHGLPRAGAELRRHVFVGFAAPLAGLPVMHWLRAHGAERFALRANTFSGLLGAVRAGLGIAVLPDYFGAELVRVLPTLRPEPLRVYLVFHPEVRRLAHVGTFAEELVRRFKQVGGLSSSS